MPRSVCVLAVAAMALCWACAGCLPEGSSLKTAEEPRPIPPDVIGTIGEYANVVGGGSLLLDGHGLVVGLGKDGSAEVPPRLRKYLVEYMLKKKVGSPLGGGRGVTPSQIIADKDTAVVRLLGVVPPGAPKGWTFDVQVRALSRTGTRSLDGGRIYAFPMHLASGEGVPPSSGARAWGQAEGTVFINPFLDPRKPSDVPRFREGRLIGGGTVLRSRPLRLILREPDYLRCNSIQRRINQRFGQPRRIANAKNPSTIELNIPPEYHRDYDHFLELVAHLPLQSQPGQWEARAREIARQMTRPGANHHGLALVWEAMGRQVTDVCRTLYASKNPAAAFHAARTGLRLKDEMAGDVVIRLATTVGSPFQVPAIEELSRAVWLLRSVPTLRRLVDDDNSLVRVAAYEALTKLGDASLITRVDVGGAFSLDLVKSRKAYVIYAAQSRERKLVLFGRDMTVNQRVFLDMPSGLVTMANRLVDVDETGEVVDLSRLSPEERARKKTTQAPRLMVFRSIPGTRTISAPLYTSFLVRELIQGLGGRARVGLQQQAKGLQLTYGQVVAVLYRMCEVEKDIPAEFVLQRPLGTGRLYRDVPTVGRPDMPGQ